MITVVRSFFRIYNNIVVDERQVHFSGASLFLHNTSQNLTSRVTVEESEDGTTWTVVPFSLADSAMNLFVDIIPQGYETILFPSLRRYLRVSLDAENSDGVFAHLVRWNPHNPEDAGEYA